VIDEVVSSGDDSPRYTGSRDTRVIPSPYEYDDEELERLLQAKNGFPAQATLPTTSTSASIDLTSGLDHELEELLHALSPPSPRAQ
jgi:hypothetical protein